MDIKLVQDTVKALSWALDMLDEDFSGDEEWIAAKATLNELRLQYSGILKNKTKEDDTT